MIAGCPGHWQFVWTGPGEDDVSEDVYYCGFDCRAMAHG